MLVKLSCLRIHLIDNKDITLGRVIREIHVNVISVHTLGTSDVAIVIIESILPSITFGVCSSTNRALRVFYSDVVSIKTDVPHLVVTGLLLSFRRIRIYIRNSITNITTLRRILVACQFDLTSVLRYYHIPKLLMSAHSPVTDDDTIILLICECFLY